MRGACILFYCAASASRTSVNGSVLAGAVAAGRVPPSEFGVDSAPNSRPGAGDRLLVPLNRAGIHEMFARSSPVRHDPWHQ
jgi:hypothetical protein